MKLAILAHVKLNSRPRGGEKSVGMIAAHLRGFMEVRVTADRGKFMSYAKWADCILTWATAAPHAASVAAVYDKPYVLMIRWWRLLQPLPPGELMNREIDYEFVDDHRYIFENAHAIITNNKWSAKAIRRYHDVPVRVAYVPRPSGGILGSGNPKGYILQITPHKGVGEESMIRRLAALLPDEKFMVVNYRGDGYGLPNVTHRQYIGNMGKVYSGAKLLIFPLYNDDCCGTSRVFIEAAQYGVPTIGNDRSGLCEKGMNKVSYNASPEEWAGKIESINQRYTRYAKRAHRSYKNYGDQLLIYKDIIEGTVRC